MNGRIMISKRGVDELVRRCRVGTIGRKRLQAAVDEYSKTRRRTAVHCPHCGRFPRSCKCPEHLRVRFANFIDGIINLIGCQRGIEKTRLYFRRGL